MKEVALLPNVDPVPAVARQVGHIAQVDASAWRDPENLASGAERKAREVKGYRRHDVLRSMQARGAPITPEHIAAAERVRVAWEIAEIGLSPGGLGLKSGIGRTAPAPRLGLSDSQIREVEAWSEFRRVVARIGPTLGRMLGAIVLANFSVPAWCRALEHEDGRRRDQKTETGRLLALLDVLAEFYGAEIAEDRARGREPA